MEPTDIQLIATRRVFGLEKKNRIKTHCTIEQELMDIMKDNRIRVPDFTNMAVAQYISTHGLPLVLIREGPNGEIIKKRPNNSDIINMAIAELLDKKGYRKSHSK